MYNYSYLSQKRFWPRFFYKALSIFLAFLLIFSPVTLYAQSAPLLNLPLPGTMVAQSPAFAPVLLKGLMINVDNPFQFDFIIDSGNTNLNQNELKKESQRLVKYFLASLTIPKNDLWVNLSPYEKDRVIPNELGKTELGRDMLAQDYLLKQLTASLIDPKRDLGKKFWDRVYKQTREKYGTTDIPINTFNKVWILPDKATVFEKGNAAYVVEARLKVLSDEDYVAREAYLGNRETARKSEIRDTSDASRILKELVIPEIEKEVNEGQNFAAIRQIYHSLILAKWYKETIKVNLLAKVYIDKNKIVGVDVDDKTIKDQIYAQYIEAYKKGVFNYIKEDYDPQAQEVITRKYVSGGISQLMDVPLNRTGNPASITPAVGNNFRLSVGATPQRGRGDFAMMAYIPGQGLHGSVPRGNNIDSWLYNHFEYGHVGYGQPELFVEKNDKSGVWELKFDRWLEGQGQAITQDYREAIHNLFNDKERRSQMTSEEVYAEVVKLRSKIKDALTSSGVIERNTRAVDELNRLEMNLKGLILSAIFTDFAENIYESEVLGAGKRNFDAKSLMARWLKYNLPIDDIESFLGEVKEKKHYVHVVGSINSLGVDLEVFGRRLLNLLGEDGKVTFVVKDERIGSDAIREDVEQLLESKFKDLKGDKRFQVVTSGSKILGTNFNTVSPDFQAVLDEVKVEKAVLGLKGETNNFTAEMVDYDHYRFFLSQQIETRRRTGIFWFKDEQEAPSPIVMWVPAGIAMTDRWEKSIFAYQMYEARQREDKKYVGESYQQRSERYKAHRQSIEKNSSSLVEELYPEALLLPFKYEGLRNDYEKAKAANPDLTFIQFARRKRFELFNEASSARVGENRYGGRIYSLRGDGKHPTQVEIVEGADKLEFNLIVNGAVFNWAEWTVSVVRAKEIDKGDGQKGKRDSISHEYVFNSFPQAGVSVNGLYFFTPALREIYNRYRANRSDEQLSEEEVNFYLDAYQTADGYENVSLYNKAYFGVKDGKLVLGRRRLLDGKLTFNFEETERTIAWTKEQVANDKQPEPSLDNDVIVYTPLKGESIEQDEKSDKDNGYQLVVGKDRMNLVVINNEIKLIKDGDVMLPSIGVVISLTKKKFMEVFGSLDTVQAKDKMTNAKFEFEWPIGEERPDWYLGGGTLLVHKGESLVRDKSVEYKNFKEEGWFNKLSMQTQETQVQDWVRGPRMILGDTMDGEIFVFAFSGRSPGVTAGANFAEAIEIIKRELGKGKKISNAINLDGGSSVSFNVRGLDGKIYTPSWPATGPDNIQGISRPVSSIVYLERKLPDRAMMGEGMKGQERIREIKNIFSAVDFSRQSLSRIDDLHNAIISLALLNGITEEELTKIRIIRAASQGRFEQGIILDRVNGQLDGRLVRDKSVEERKKRGERVEFHQVRGVQLQEALKAKFDEEITEAADIIAKDKGKNQLGIQIANALEVLRTIENMISRLKPSTSSAVASPQASARVRIEEGAVLAMTPQDLYRFIYENPTRLERDVARNLNRGIESALYFIVGDQLEGGTRLASRQVGISDLIAMAQEREEPVAFTRLTLRLKASDLSDNVFINIEPHRDNVVVKVMAGIVGKFEHRKFEDAVIRALDTQRARPDSAMMATPQDKRNFSTQMMKEYQAVLADVDFTLTDENRHIPLSIIKQKANLLKKGVKIGLASARAYQLTQAQAATGVRGMEEVIDQLKTELGTQTQALENLYLFPENSSFGLRADKPSEKIDFGLSSVSQDKEFVEQLEALFAVQKKGSLILKDYVITWRLAQIEGSQIEAIRESVHGLVIRLGRDYNVTKTESSVEITPKGGGKDRALKEFSKILNINESAIASIGDQGAKGGNDEPLIDRDGGFSVDHIEKDSRGVKLAILIARTRDQVALWFLNNLRFKQTAGPASDKTHVNMIPSTIQDNLAKNARYGFGLTIVTGAPFTETTFVERIDHLQKGLLEILGTKGVTFNSTSPHVALHSTLFSLSRTQNFDPSNQQSQQDALRKTIPLDRLTEAFSVKLVDIIKEAREYRIRLKVLQLDNRPGVGQNGELLANGELSLQAEFVSEEDKKSFEAFASALGKVIQQTGLEVKNLTPRVHISLGRLTRIPTPEQMKKLVEWIESFNQDLRKTPVEIKIDRIKPVLYAHRSLRERVYEETLILGQQNFNPDFKKFNERASSWRADSAMLGEARTAQLERLSEIQKNLGYITFSPESLDDIDYLKYIINLLVIENHMGDLEEKRFERSDGISEEKFKRSLLAMSRSATAKAKSVIRGEKKGEDIKPQLRAQLSIVLNALVTIEDIISGERDGKLVTDSAMLAGVERIPNAHVRLWVDEVAFQMGASSVEVVDDSDDSRLINEMVQAGELIRLPDGNYYARSHPQDVARSEERTFVATGNPQDKGVYNNWRPTSLIKPEVMKRIQGSAKGGKVYVIPYLMGPEGSPFSQVGVQITNSRYVAVNMIRMTKVGRAAWDALKDTSDFVKGIHSTGDLEKIKRTGKEDDDRYFVSFPDERTIISFGSGYGGNALLGKKFFSLRQASKDGFKHGWLAEHMLILEIEDRLTGEKKYITAAFPSASGKTNLAMLEPPAGLQDRYRVRVIGDDIAWLRIGPDGRLFAINPENGFFGVVPGTNAQTNPNFFKAIGRGTETIFTNVAYNTKTGEVWWEGKTPEYPSLVGDGQYWIDWKGQKIIDRPEDKRTGKGNEWAHPNSRATTLAKNAPNISPEFTNPNGVPISAIFFGGRVDKLEPLIRELPTFERGIYDGATMGVQATFAAEGKEGMLRRDPMALRPFFSIHEIDYFRHWLNIFKKLGSKAPKIYHVNWFRKGEDGKFLWTGFGDNLRVLLWALDRAEGKGQAIETPIGFIPTVDAINTEGLNVPKEKLVELFSYDPRLWLKEVEDQSRYLDSFEDATHKVPEEFRIINAQMREGLLKQLGDKAMMAGEEDKQKEILDPFSALQREKAYYEAWLRSLGQYGEFNDEMQWEYEEASKKLEEIDKALAKMMGEIESKYRKPIVGGNLKREFKSPEQIRQLLIGIADELQKQGLDPNEIDVFVALTELHLSDFVRELKALEKEGRIPAGLIKVGAQNVAHRDQLGAFTGQHATATQLKEYDVAYVIVGHSEDRRGNEEDHESIRWTESNEYINAKVHSLIAAGLTPVVAFGESAEERKQGQEFDIVRQQVLESLAGVTAEQILKSGLVLAYEPVWAIGKKALRPATKEEANEMQRFVRQLMLENFGEEVARQIRIQYGGSVSPKNVGELANQLNIDGGLIGGAAKQGETFLPILREFAIAGARILSEQKKSPDRAMMSREEVEQKILKIIRAVAQKRPKFPAIEPKTAFYEFNFTFEEKKRLNNLIKSRFSFWSEGFGMDYRSVANVADRIYSELQDRARGIAGRQVSLTKEEVLGFVKNVLEQMKLERFVTVQGGFNRWSDVLEKLHREGEILDFLTLLKKEFHFSQSGRDLRVFLEYELQDFDGLIRYLEHQKELKERARKKTDQAMMSAPGGIDMNQIDINKEGPGVDIQFTPQEMQNILQNGIDGLAPVIINIVPVTNILPLLGLEPQTPREQMKVSSTS